MELLSAILTPVVVLVSEQRNLNTFLLVTIALGGGASWLTGRAVAQGWRPWWHAAALMPIIGGAVRFLHMALFEGTLLSPYFYCIDTAFCMAFGLISFRVMRVRQMVECYGWINARAGLLQWRHHAAADHAETG